MRRRLSSFHTFIQKIIIPVIWFTGLGIGTLAVFDQSEQTDKTSPWIFLLFGLTSILFLYWGCIRLKVVSLDESFLYVSNYLKEISIPLSEVAAVRENRWLNGNLVTIHLKSPSEFGNKIIFMRKVIFLLLWRSHPVVSELERLARSKGGLSKRNH